jgi:hypothetical protein
VLGVNARPGSLDGSILRSQILPVKTITYPLELDAELYLRVTREAERRQKKVEDMFREVIANGIPAPPVEPNLTAVIQETWDKLGPAPEVGFAKC